MLELCPLRRTLLSGLDTPLDAYVAGILTLRAAQIARQPSADRFRYVHPETVILFRDWQVAQGVDRGDLLRTQSNVRDFLHVPPISDATSERAFRILGNDWWLWPPSLRFATVNAFPRLARPLEERSDDRRRLLRNRTPPEAMDNMRAVTSEPRRNGIPPPCRNCTDNPDLHAACDVDQTLGLGCTRCRLENRACHVYITGQLLSPALTRRPEQERKWYRKCRSCTLQNINCSWLIERSNREMEEKANLGLTCNACNAAGIQCKPLEPLLNPMPSRGGRRGGIEPRLPADSVLGRDLFGLDARPIEPPITAATDRVNGPTKKPGEAYTFQEIRRLPGWTGNFEKQVTSRQSSDSGACFTCFLNGVEPKDCTSDRGAACRRCERCEQT